MPFGGKTQRSPSQAMAALLPVLPGSKTEQGSVMAWACDPDALSADPYTGAHSAVYTSVAKIVAAGADYHKAYLTLQEFFEKLRNEPVRWGKPFTALLGALDAQLELGAAAIGGKDSMSGTFLDHDVPPTLISFAIAPVCAGELVTTDFKSAGHGVYLFYGGTAEQKTAAWERFTALARAGKAASAWAVENGLAEAVMKMSLGNEVGFAAASTALDWYRPMPGAIVAELTEEIPDAVCIGITTAEKMITIGNDEASISELLALNDSVLESVYPTKTQDAGTVVRFTYETEKRVAPAVKTARPKALIPVFPGTNCEYDTQRALLEAGADAEQFIIRNLTSADVADSVERFAKAVKDSQIIVIPGGFSYGDVLGAGGGWAKTIRDLKTFGFIELNDGSCFRNLQVVMSADELENYKEIAAQNVGAALIVKGTVVLTPEAKQPLEVKATEIKVEGVSSPDYPLQKKRHSVEYLRTIQHLRPRTNLFSAAFRVRSAAAYAVHEFFQSRGFVYVNTPIITGSDCEGAGEMFQVTTLDLENPPRTPDGKVDYSKDFFGKKTSLTVSGQLNAENFAMAFGDVYTFGPTFRAENSNTARHAAEFWMIEPEMAFCDLDGDLEVMEAMVKHIIRRVMERCPDDLAFFNSFVDKGLLERLQHVESSDFGRVTYTEAVKLLKESGQKFDYPVEWGIDLQTEHERYLTEQIFKRPVFVTDYPQEIKAFYMRLNDDGKTVAAADCLVPGIGEIIGGSQREERIELLEKRIRELGMNPEDYWWYGDLRRYGSCRHAGFGLGFERMVMYLTGIGNIRDVELHPRTVGNADF